MSIRRIDPAEPRGRLYRLHGRLVSTRVMRRLALTRLWGAIVWPLDRVLLRVTRGRVGTASPVPTHLLETRGARSGLPRTTGVIYFHDGDRVIIVASNAGRRSHPGWYHNLRADPEVVFGGEPYRAEVVTAPETQRRLWTLADRVFPAFAAYRTTAARDGRTIPLISLTARSRVTEAPSR